LHQGETLKKFATFGGVALFALALTSCSSASTTADPADAPAAASASASASPSAETVAAPESTQATQPSSEAKAEDQNLSERGNPTVKLGEKIYVKDAEGQVLVEYTLTAFDPKPKCTNGTGWEPANGTFAAIQVEAQTFKGVDKVNSNGWALKGYDFKAIRPDGTTSNADAVTTPSLNCFESKDRLVEMNDSEKAKGWVVLDLEEPSGTLVYKDSFSDVTWELAYPAK